jgi:hypothetical protein
MPKPTETHLDIVFNRAVRVRRADISGDSVKQGEPIMRIVKPGERLTVAIIPAREMVIHESAFRYNKDRHEELLESLKTAKKAA